MSSAQHGEAVFDSMPNVHLEHCDRALAKMPLLAEEHWDGGKDLQGCHQKDDTAGSGQLSREIPHDAYLHKIMKTLTRLHGEEAY